VLPTCSRCDGENRLKLGRIFTIFDAIGENSEHKSFDFGYGLRTTQPVSHGPRKRRHLGDPTTIILELCLNSHEFSVALTFFERKPCLLLRASLMRQPAEQSSSSD